MIQSTCVQCGDREDMVPGVTLISVNGQLEQQCIRAWEESHPRRMAWGVTRSQHTRRSYERG